ncbi:F-box protein At5g07670-like [Typha latifolia]|uniref:F-box protein At5g07670-like n=1 Tax=Typha latifolia TaxID=4733 RepID=UPI003C2E1FB8
MHQGQHQRQHQHQRLKSWPGLWFRDTPLKHVVVKMQLGDQKLTLDPSPSSDLTALLSDEILLRILSGAPSHFLPSASLVCKRWFRLAGRLRRSLTLLDWSFLHRRLHLRFPDLTDIDVLPASFSTSSASTSSSSSLVLSRGAVTVSVDPYADPPVGDSRFVSADSIDRGLETLARSYPSLRKLSLAAPPASESGLMAVAGRCATLQEIELHRCTDLVLRSISAFENLQILRLVGSVEGLYRGPGVTDIGLTILAHGCKRLVKLELAGCEGSYDGISAIGRCCMMLEELTICDHRMDAGWMAGLAFCGNLKTLRLQGCRRIDTDPGPVEHLGSCPAIERVQMQRCQIRNKRSLFALFMVCEAAKEIMFQNCWGLDNDMFSCASVCRRVKFLCLEGCSLLTIEGLESVILSWNDLQNLAVVSCNNIKDSEVSPALASLFSDLKELKWRPDTKSLLAMSLAGTGMGKKGGRFFKRWNVPGQQRLKGKVEEDSK